MVTPVIEIEDLRGEAGFCGQDDVPIGLKLSEEQPSGDVQETVGYTCLGRYICVLSEYR